MSTSVDEHSKRPLEANSPKIVSALWTKHGYNSKHLELKNIPNNILHVAEIVHLPSEVVATFKKIGAISKRSYTVVSIVIESLEKTHQFMPRRLLWCVCWSYSSDSI